MIRGGSEVRSRTKYILGTDRRLLQNMKAQDARHKTDHYLVLGCLHRSAYSCYLKERNRFPLNPSKDSGTCQPPVHGALGGHTQSTLAGTAQAGVDTP